MIIKRCQNCAKQYFCKDFKKKKEECKNFVSWIETPNYGEPKRMEVANDQRRFEEL